MNNLQVQTILKLKQLAKIWIVLRLRKITKTKLWTQQKIVKVAQKIIIKALTQITNKLKQIHLPKIQIRHNKIILHKTAVLIVVKQIICNKIKETKMEAKIKLFPLKVTIIHKIRIIMNKTLIKVDKTKINNNKIS